MFRSKKFRPFVLFLNQIVVFWTILALVLQAPLAVYAQNIVADGRTQTAVNVNGSVTDVTTNTINGANAYNSFSKFNVPAQTTANLHVPNAANNLINLVHNERSEINGILNSYKNGQIGGNVYFLNPHGVIVGAGGVVNVGSLSMLAPTQQYMNDLLSKHGEISAVHERMLFEGNVPLSETGLISVKGKINAIDTIKLGANGVSVDSGAAIRAGRQVQVEFGNIVNVNGIQAGNDIVVSPDGKISIVATNNVNVAGTIAADGVSGSKAGDVEIRSGGDIFLDNGANISAKGSGENSDGGNVIVFADNDSYLADGALIDVSGGGAGLLGTSPNGSGDGGFLELSAAKTVNIIGNGLKASATNGNGGTILIDPTDIVWNGSTNDQFSNGANYNLTASNSISLSDVVISSRVVSGTGRAAHQTGDSTGNSGNITITAPNITLTNSQILAHATGTRKAGDVTITLDANNPAAQYSPYYKSEAVFSMDKDSKITGNDVSIKAIAGANFAKLAGDDESVAANLLDELDKVLDAVVGAVTSNIPVLNVFKAFEAVASITIDGDIVATGNVDITTEAFGEISMENSAGSLAFLGGFVTTKSKIAIGANANITTSGGDISIKSIAESNMELGDAVEHDKRLKANLALGVGLSFTENIITVASGASLEASGDLTIVAETAEEHSVGSEGGDSEATACIAAAVLYSDSQTSVLINGTLIAGGNISISANTDASNSTSSAIGMGDNFWKNYEGKNPTELLSVTGLVNLAKEKLLGLFNNNVEPETPPAEPEPESASSWSSVGIAAALSAIVTDINTNVTIGGAARLTAANDIDINAETISSHYYLATSEISASTGEDGNPEKKATAASFAVPIAVLNNSSKAIVKNGAIIKANGDISVTSQTAIPYNFNHPIQAVIEQWMSGEFSTSDIEDLLGIIGPNMGIDKGFVNSWTQATSSAEETAIAGMISLLICNNTTVAQLENGVTIGKKDGGNKPNLTVDATTVVEQGNFVGALKSFFSSMPSFDNPLAPKTEGPMTQAETNKLANDKTFGSMMGSDAASAIGGAFLGTFITNTTIARIDGGDVDVADLEVNAESKLLDIGLTVGGGQASGTGFNGMAGLTYYDAYTLAKIDDAAKITADSVKIDALDDAIRIGIAGTVTMSNSTAIGISVIGSVVTRDAHAVWGNLLDKDGNLQTIKGDSAKESLFIGTAPTSVVTGDIDITAEASGLNIVLAGAGSATTEAPPQPPVPGQPASKPSNPAEELMKIFELVPAKGDSAKPSITKKVSEALAKCPAETPVTGQQQSQGGFGISGAIAVNYLSENISAGISGNVDIAAKNITVNAINGILDIAIVPSVSVALNANSKGAIAGAIGVNILDGDTLAYIDGNNKTANFVFEKLTVESNRKGQIGAATVSGAGSSGDKSVNFAGAVSFAWLNDDTLALLRNVEFTATDATKLKAANDALIVNIAGGLAVGGKASIGVSIAAAVLQLNAQANIINSLLNAKSLAVYAENASSIITLALAGGVAPSGSLAIGGTIAVVISDGTTGISIDGSTVTLSGDFLALAFSKAGIGGGNYYKEVAKETQDAETGDTTYLSENGETLETKDDDGSQGNTQLALGLAGRSPKIVTAALAVAVGDKVAVGANIGLNILTDATRVSFKSSTITSTLGNANIDAITEGGAIAIGIGVAASTGGAAVSGNVGVNLVGGETAVIFDNSKLSAKNAVTVDAKNAAGIIDISVNVAIGSQVGVGASFAYNQVAHGTIVRLENASDISGSSVALNAANNADIIAALLSVGGGGTAGVGVALAINTIGSLAGTESNDAKNRESLADEQKFNDNLKSDFGNGSNIDLIAKATNTTGVEILSGSKVTANKNDIMLGASNTGKMISISIGAGFGGTVGVGAAASYNNISAASHVWASDSTLSSTSATGKITGTSNVSGDIYAVSIGAGGGGTVGVGAGVAINVLMGTNSISLQNAATTAGGDISLSAKNSGDIIAVAGGVAGGGVVGVGAGVTTNVIKSKTIVEILGGTTKSTAGSISLFAENDNKIIAVAASGAGAGVVGVAGSLAVNLIYSETVAGVQASILNTAETAVLQAGIDISVAAESTGKILSIAGAIAGAGVVGVAGAIAYNELNNKTLASVSSASLTAGGNILVAADVMDNWIKSIVVAAAGAGIVGVAVANANNVFNGKTTAEITNSALTATGNFTQRAKSDGESVIVTVAIGGAGVVGVAAPIVLHLWEQTVNSVIKNSDITATNGSLDVSAIDDKTTTSAVAGIAGGIVGVGASLAVIVSGGTTEINVDNAGKSLISGGDLKLTANNTNTVKAGIGTAAGGLVGVGVSIAVNHVTQKTNIKTSGTMQSGGNIDISAKGKLDFSNNVIAIGGGAVGVGGSIGVTILGDETVLTLNGAISAKNNVNLTAKSEVVTKNTLGAAAGGAVAVGGGIDILAVSNAAKIINGANITATTGNITANANLIRNIDTTTYAAGIGGVGVAAAISVVLLGGTANTDENAAVKDSVAYVNKALKETKTSEDSKSSIQKEVIAENALTANSNSSALITSFGSMSALNGSISLTASANNTANIKTYGAGGGGVGIGAAIGVLSVKDNVETNISNLLKANTINIKSLNTQNLNNRSIAGGAGFVGLGAAYSGIFLESKADTIIGGTLVAKTINANAEQDVSIDSEADAAGIGAVGIAGAISNVVLLGNSSVSINSTAKLYGNTTNIKAYNYFRKLNSEAWGVAAGLGAGALTVSTISTQKASVTADSKDGKTSAAYSGTAGARAIVNIAKDSVLDVKEKYTNDKATPDYLAHSLNIMALSEFHTNNEASIKALGFAGGGASTAVTYLNSLSQINVDSQNIRHGGISMYADQSILSGSRTLASADVVAIYGVINANSIFTATQTNQINVNSGANIESWASISLTSGGASNSFSALASTENNSLTFFASVPVAVATFNRSDDIKIVAATLKSFEDIRLTTNAGSQDIIGKSELTNWFLEALEDIANFFGADVSLVITGGKTNKSLTDSISITGATLEAGFLYDVWLKIDGNGIITTSDKFPEYAVDTNQKPANIFADLVTDREARLTALQTALATGKVTDTSAFDIEIAALEAEIASLVALSSYYTGKDDVSVIRFIEDIRASSGDIQFNTNKLTTSGGSFTAHGSPSILIENKSGNFLQFGIPDVNKEGENTVAVAINDRAGGWIMHNGNLINSAGSGTTFSSAHDGVVSIPKIDIKNLYAGQGTKLAGELLLTNAALSNRGGTINLDSTGSIWVDGASSIDARDLVVRTDKVFFQGFKKGLYNLNGSTDYPSDKFSSLQEYLSWKANCGTITIDIPLFGKITVASNQTFSDVIDAEIQKLYNSYFVSNGTDLFQNVNDRITDIKSFSTDSSFDAFTLPYAISAISYSTQAAADTAAAGSTLMTGTFNDLEMIGEDGNVLNFSYYSIFKIDNNNFVLLKYTTNTNYLNTSVLAAISSDQAHINALAVAKTNYNTALSTLSAAAGKANDENFGAKVAALQESLANKDGIAKVILTESEINKLASNLSSGKITAGSSVFISAELLNVNGTIESGWLDYNINLNQDAVNTAITNYKNAGVFTTDLDLTSIIYAAANTDSTAENYYGHKIGVYYNNASDSIILNDVVSQGGSITLFGNIISTGYGKLSVADGFGNITITGNDNYGLALGKVDAGLNLEGLIRITDTSKDNGIGKYLTTEYTRLGGVTNVMTNTGTNGAMINVGNSSVYSPTENRWLVNVVAENKAYVSYVHETEKQYSFFGLGGWGNSTSTYAYTDYLSLTPANVDLGDFIVIKDFTTTYSGLSNSATVIGEYFYDYQSTKIWKNTDISTTFHADVQEALQNIKNENNLNTESAKWDNWYYDNFWHTIRKRESDYATASESLKIWRTYVNVSRDIAIDFFGNEDISKSNVSITGKNTITLNDLVRSANTVSISSTGGSILGGTNGLITTQNVNLSAAGDIRGVDTGSPLQLEAAIINNTLKPMMLSTASAKNINLNYKGSELYVNSAKSTAGDFKLISTGSVLMNTGQTGIESGGKLYIEAGTGKIAATDGSAFKMKAADNVTLNASSDIVVDFSSDLYADSIVSTGGNIELNVNGSIYDRNPNETPDMFSDAERTDFWESLGFLASDDEKYQKRLGDIENSYIGGKTAELLDEVKFDLHTESQFTFTDAEKANLKNLGWTDDMLGAQQSELRTLQSAYFNALAKAKTDYIEAQTVFLKNSVNFAEHAEASFTFTQSERNAFKAFGWTDDMLNAQQTALSGLTDKSAYTYVIATNDTGLTQQLNFVTDNRNSYKYDAASDAALQKLLAAAEINETKLKQALPASLFLQAADAGTRQNTTSMIEAPNISGVNVIVTANGSIGESAASAPIIISGISDLFPVGGATAEQKAAAKLKLRALADAEWDDVTLKKDANGNITKMSIVRYDNINIEATGTLKTTSGSGWTNIGSQGDVNIDNTAGAGIVAGANGTQSLRLKTDGGIYAANYNNPAIWAKNAVLEAAGGKIGFSNNSPLIVNLSGTTAADGWITARGRDGVFLSFGSNGTKDAYVREIGSSGGDIYVSAASILNALGIVGKDSAQIGGVNIVLVATSGSIGTTDSGLGIAQQAVGSVSLAATAGAWVFNPSGSLNFVNVATGSGNDFVARALQNITLSGAGINNASFDLDAINGDIEIATTVNSTGNFNAKAGNDILVNAALTIGGTLDFLATENIRLNDLVSVKNGGAISMTATTGEISDGNDTSISQLMNIDASGSALTMQAALGIGCVGLTGGNAIETNVKSLNLSVSGNGNIVLANMQDTVLINATTTGTSPAANIDIYSAGTLQIGDVSAGGLGSNIQLGAIGDIVFGDAANNATLDATNLILVVSQGGDILGSATLSAAESYLNAQNGNIDVSVNTSNKLNLVAGGDINATKTNDGDFILGKVFAGGKIETAAKNTYGIKFDELLGKELNVDADEINLGSLNTSVDFSLADFWTDLGNPPNNALGNAQQEIKLGDGESMKIVNKKAGGTIEIDDVTIEDGKGYEVSVDNLVIGSITGGSGSSFSHIGADGGNAQSTTISDIVSDGDFVFGNLFSDNVNINSSNLGGRLIVQDGRTAGQASFGVNGVNTRIDAVDKRQRSNSDFWLWTLNGNYGLSANASGLNTTNGAMRVLAAYRNDLLLNGNHTNSDSAFENDLTDMRGSEAMQEFLKRLFNTPNSGMSFADLISGSPIHGFQFNFGGNGSGLGPAIVPIKDEDEEKDKPLALEHISDPSFPELALAL